MKLFRYFWPQFVNTNCIERIGVNKLTELTCFANLLEIFIFSLLFPGKKTFPTTFGYPERNVLAFSQFLLKQRFCRSIVMPNLKQTLDCVFSRFPCQKNQVILFFKIRASFFVKILITCLFSGPLIVQRFKCKNTNTLYLC